MAFTKGHEIPTIDVALVTAQVGSGDELAFDTASQIAVEPQVNEEDPVQLVVKGILRAQKPAVSTLTGNQITLTDNVFNPELVKILQGGVIKYWQDDDHSNTSDQDMGHGVASYTPPVAGSAEKGTPFILNAYTAIYDAAGLITGYEKISYPNCQGTPVALSSEDGAFRAPEYTINSAPKTGEAPYVISYVDELPTGTLGTLTVQSIAGTDSGDTHVTVTPTKGGENSYVYKTGASVSLPAYQEVCNTGSGYTEWDGTSDITAATGQKIVVVEVDSADRAVKAGQTTVTAQV